MDQFVHRKVVALATASGTLLLLALMGMAGEEEKKMDPEKQKQELAKIFKTEALWGKDLAPALVRLPSWSALAEDKVAVFPHVIMGTRPFKSSAEAKETLKKLDAAMRAKPAKVQPQFQPLLQQHVGEQAPPFHAEIHTSPDDHMPRLAWTGPQVQFLKEGLTITTVQQQLGGPEKVTRQVIQTEGDRRPVTLTLHLYAGGAVAFAESDFNPKPGIVDRAIVSVPAIKTGVFSQE